jgi:hypothetical protein
VIDSYAMNTKELLAELTEKLKRLAKLEEAFGGSATGKRKKKGPMSQATKDKISKKRKAAWAAKKAKEKG